MVLSCSSLHFINAFFSLDCNYSHCKNGGTCTTKNADTEYTCSCTDGWTGSNCGLVGKTCFHN